jgi:hypothetical protein
MGSHMILQYAEELQNIVQLKAEKCRLFDYVNKQGVLDWSLNVQFSYNLYV